MFPTEVEELETWTGRDSRDQTDEWGVIPTQNKRRRHMLSVTTNHNKNFYKVMIDEMCYFIHSTIADVCVCSCSRVVCALFLI